MEADSEARKASSASANLKLKMSGAVFVWSPKGRQFSPSPFLETQQALIRPGIVSRGVQANSAITCTRKTVQDTIVYEACNDGLPDSILARTLQLRTPLHVEFRLVEKQYSAQHKRKRRIVTSAETGRSPIDSKLLLPEPLLRFHWTNIASRLAPMLSAERSISKEIKWDGAQTDTSRQLRLMEGETHQQPSDAMTTGITHRAHTCLFINGYAETTPLVKPSL